MKQSGFVKTLWRAMNPMCYRVHPYAAACGRKGTGLREKIGEVTCPECLQLQLKRYEIVWGRWFKRLRVLKDQRQRMLEAVGSPDDTPESAAEAAAKMRSELLALRMEVNDLRQRNASQPRQHLLQELVSLRGKLGSSLTVGKTQLDVTGEAKALADSKYPTLLNFIEREVVPRLTELFEGAKFTLIVEDEALVLEVWTTMTAEEALVRLQFFDERMLYSGLDRQLAGKLLVTTRLTHA